MAKPNKKKVHYNKSQTNKTQNDKAQNAQLDKSSVSASTNVISTQIAKKPALQSKDQKRAKHALDAIERLKQSQSDHAKIKSAVAGLPALIHMNGLGHAFAFFLSDVKNFPEREKIVQIVFDWLKKDGEVLKNDVNISALNAITQIDMVTYQIAQQEAQAYLLWLKKFGHC